VSSPPCGIVACPTPRGQMLGEVVALLLQVQFQQEVQRCGARVRAALVAGRAGRRCGKLRRWAAGSGGRGWGHWLGRRQSAPSHAGDEGCRSASQGQQPRQQGCAHRSSTAACARPGGWRCFFVQAPVVGSLPVADCCS